MPVDANWQLIRSHIPDYLSDLGKDGLIRELRSSFPRSDDPGKVFTSHHHHSGFLQGDGVLEIPLARWDKDCFSTKYHSALILSNSCDISTENKRLSEPNVVFAAIFPLDSFLGFLSLKDISHEQIEAFVRDLKRNVLTSYLYLPAIGDFQESFVQFDYLSSLPISALSNYSTTFVTNGGDRIFTLTNYGFYLLIVKMSIHFCRLREGVHRGNL